MRRVIDERAYDTSTAEPVCDVSAPYDGRRDLAYDNTTLYRSPRGQWFIAGEGGPASRWAVSAGQNTTSGGEGLRLVTEDDARRMIERHGTPEAYALSFGEPEEG